MVDYKCNLRIVSDNSSSRTQSSPKMSTALTLSEPRANLPSADLAPHLAAALQYARAEKSVATRKAYKTDFEIFGRWCDERGLAGLPAAPETVAGFLAHQADQGAKPSTVGRRCAAIRYAHRLAGHQSPTDAEAVKATVRGIRRTLGSVRSRKAPATSDLVLAMAALAKADTKGLRDRALLLLGFAGAFRRSELVALDIADLGETEAGLVVTIRRSKTDQEGQGRTVAIVRGGIACPVRAVRRWVETAAVIEGPLFRPVRKGGSIGKNRLSDKQVARTIKAFASLLGLDVDRFSAHSLRAGFLTSAAAKGANIFKMRDVSGHRSMDTLQGYVRSAEIFQDHAGAGLL